MQLLHSREQSLIMRPEKTSDIYSLMWNNEESKSPMGRNMLFGTHQRESSQIGSRVSPAPSIFRNNDLSGNLIHPRYLKAANGNNNVEIGKIKKAS